MRSRASFCGVNIPTAAKVELLGAGDKQPRAGLCELSGVEQAGPQGPRRPLVSSQKRP